MKIKRLCGNWGADTIAMCHMIDALKTARDVSNVYRDGYGRSTSFGFQRRCNDAIVALASRLMEDRVERFYGPETKRFRVTYDVMRSGRHEMEVEAESEAEAKAKAEEILARMPEDDVQKLSTEPDAMDVVEVKEEKEAKDASK